MLKRSLFFTNPAYLSTKDQQLVVKSNEGIVNTIPLEDIGFVVLENPQISITLPAMQKLNANNVALVCCDEKHHPSALLLNLDSHHLQGELFRNQIQASEPLKKNLWKQVIEQKIANQSALLEKLGKQTGALPQYAKTVNSGDTSNREGAAAREYWKNLFGNNFFRDRYGANPNPFLNYGYIILRAAVARALVGSGLLPTLGIHHHNRYNAYCLADDIMEPYRPFVDSLVYELWESGTDDMILEKESKAHLLQVLTTDVRIGKVKRPLMVALSITTASLTKCFNGETKKLACPTI
jgi:CRISPR-associated protein Cas1